MYPKTLPKSGPLHGVASSVVITPLTNSPKAPSRFGDFGRFARADEAGDRNLPHSQKADRHDEHDGDHHHVKRRRAVLFAPAKVVASQPKADGRGEGGQRHEHGQQTQRVPKIEHDCLPAAVIGLLGEYEDLSPTTGNTHGMRFNRNPPMSPNTTINASGWPLEASALAASTGAGWLFAASSPLRGNCHR